MVKFAPIIPELQKVGTLVSRTPDISGRKFRHFQIVAANLSIFGIKRLQRCWFMTQFNSKWINWRRKQTFVQYHTSYCGKIRKNTNFGHFELKIRKPDEKSLFATLHHTCNQISKWIVLASIYPVFFVTFCKVGYLKTKQVHFYAACLLPYTALWVSG